MTHKNVKAHKAESAIEQDLQTTIDFLYLYCHISIKLLFNSIEVVQEAHQKYTNKDLVVLVMYDDNEPHEQKDSNCNQTRPTLIMAEEPNTIVLGEKIMDVKIVEQREAFKTVGCL